MEGRFNMRIPVKTFVGIYYPGQLAAFAYGRTRDISFGGVYVEADSIDAPNNAIVYVRFMLQHQAEDESFKMPALVARSDAGGLGLMFVDSDAEYSNMLIDFLRCRLDVMFGRERHDSIGYDSEVEKRA
jgi:PilZ domain